MPPTDIEPRSIGIGTHDNGVDLLVLTHPETGERTIDLMPVGAADARDEGMAIRLTPGLAAGLARQLAELAEPTGR